MCYTPLTLKDDRIVPCGRCRTCINAKIASWLFRLEQHQKIVSNARFITLTYSNTYLPLIWSDFHQKEVSTLNRIDIQRFMKRLRQEQIRKFKNKLPLSYIAVGEYGKRFSKRPHYHLIIYNLDERIDVQKVWSMGIVKNLPVLDGGISYVLKYMNKDVTFHSQDIREKGRFQCSKNLGINYIDEKTLKYHNQSLEHCHLTFPGGRKTPMPRYYRLKIYNEDFRNQLTEYFQRQNSLTFQQQINLLRRTYPTKTEDFIINILNIRKQFATFEKRLNPTL
jgi:hypothetical protein